MHIQLIDVLSQDGQVLHREIPLELDTVEVGAEHFVLSAKSPVAVDVTHMSGRVLHIEARCHVSALIPCGRCLEEVERTFSVSLSRDVDMKKMETEQGLDEYSLITGTELDVDRMIHNELLVQWPLRVLCREDCKGICSRCGTNLNYHNCDCENQSLDPRMAAISDIFSKFKEE